VIAERSRCCFPDFFWKWCAETCVHDWFAQARQAYLTGNKALAKELSAKGQWHNEQMKAAHSKAGEAIFWQRFCSTSRGIFVLRTAGVLSSGFLWLLMA
jgi:hypothetical protein